MTDFEALFLGHRGKVSDKWSLYLREYGRLFAPLKDRPVRLLEIGVQNGGSLELWARYFKNAAAIVGCDVNPLCAGLRYEDPRVRVLLGDAGAAAVVRELASLSPRYDIIIDDGSHRSGDIVRAFAGLFPLLEPGGLFVVEDLHCGYWGNYQGGLRRPFSSIAFFKGLVDVVNAEHWGTGEAPAGYVEPFAREYGLDVVRFPFDEIHSVEFVNSMCVVRKSEAGLNTLGPRRMSGTEAAVVPGLPKEGSLCETPDQRWPARLSAEWAGKVAGLKRRLGNLRRASRG